MPSKTRKTPPPTPGEALAAAILDAFDLDETSLAELRHLCAVADRLAELEAIEAREGTMITTPDGQPRVHPAAVEHRQLSLAYARLRAALTQPVEGQRRTGVRGVYAVPGVA